MTKRDSVAFALAAIAYVISLVGYLMMDKWVAAGATPFVITAVYLLLTRER